MSRLKSILENAEEEEGHPQQPAPLVSSKPLPLATWPPDQSPSRLMLHPRLLSLLSKQPHFKADPSKSKPLYKQTPLETTLLMKHL